MLAANVLQLGEVANFVSQMYQFKNQLPSTKPALKFA